jgi:non-ribosomal peptide synthetase component F
MKIVAEIISDINTKISDIEIITEKEKFQLLNKFNNTKVDYPKEETIISLFEKQVEKTPENTALRCKNNNISYKELNDKSEQIAAYLINVHGVKSGDFIGIMLDLEEYTIISILGILKAGCAYVPLETNYPAKRINSIAESSRLKVIITLHQYQFDPLTIKSNFVNVDEIFDYTHNEHIITADIEVNPNQFAIEIFIPDSSGKLRGTKIKHSSIVNYSYWADSSYIKYEKATIPLFTPITSYLSISSIFVPLITGNTIYIYAKDEKYSQIDNILNDNNVNIIKLAPSHLKLIKDSNYLKLKKYKSKIKHVIVSGGQLSSKLAKEILDLFNGDVEIYSEYVLMEEKIGCAFYKFEPGSINNEFIPIGQPINNFQIYILDKYLKPVPKGVLGELYISSNGLANEDESNHLNIKEETITNAFFQGKSIHKTNEHAKWTANGNVEIIQSNQRHVYINETIVNLQELEYYIKGIENIKDCYVIIKNSNEIGSFLSAYIVVSKSINIFPVINELFNKISKNTIPKELHIVDHLNEIKNINSFDIDSLLEYENEYVLRKIDLDEFTINEKTQITEEKHIENDFKF